MIQKSFIICSTPRSGSYLLADLLSQAGLPFAEEWLTPAQISAQKRKFGLGEDADIQSYLNALLKNESEDGFFGMKLMYPQFDILMTEINQALRDSSGKPLDRFMEYFPSPHFVYLIRKDEVKKAISLVKAKQTGRWVNRVDENKSEKIEPSYSFLSINEVMIRQGNYNRKWMEFFRDQSIKVMTVYYEDLLEDSQGVVSSILKFMEMESKLISQIRTDRTFNKASNSINSNWNTKFLSEQKMCQLNAPPPLFRETKNLESELIFSFENDIIANETNSIRIYFEAPSYAFDWNKITPLGEGWPRICWMFEGFDEYYYCEFELRKTEGRKGYEAYGLCRIPPQAGELTAIYAFSNYSIRPRSLEVMSELSCLKIEAFWPLPKQMARETIGDIKELRSGWQYTEWLGYFLDDKYPWVFHQDHEWLYFKEAEEETGLITLYDCALGWVKTNRTLYPKFITEEDGKEVTFLYRKDNTRIFSVGTNTLVEHPVNSPDKLKNINLS